MAGVVGVTGMAGATCLLHPTMEQQPAIIAEMEKACAFNGGMAGGYRIQSRYDAAGNLTSMVCSFPNGTVAQLTFCKDKP